MRIRELSRALAGGLILSAAMLLAGCVSSRKAATYILYPETAPSGQFKAMVRVFSVKVPEYLDGKSMMVRTGKHAIGSLADHQWMQNFRTMLQAALATELLGRSSMENNAPQFILAVEVRRFELDSSNRLHLLAECQLSRKNSNPAAPDAQLFSFSSAYQWDGYDVEALVGLYDKAIADMAESIMGKAVAYGTSSNEQAVKSK